MTTADLHEMPLLDLFLMETGAQCLNLNRELARWGAVQSPLERRSLQSPIEGRTAPPPPLPSPASGRGGALEGDDTGGPDFSAMQRAIHSITGAARLVDLQPIIDLTQAMEHGLMIAAANPTPESRQPLESAINQLSQLSQIKTNQLLDALEERKGILTNLAYQLRKQGTSTPSPAEGESPALTPEQPILGGQGLFQIFTEDAENQLAVLSDNLIQIEKTPQAGVLLESSMRAVHSLKGAARIIGLTGIVTLTHNMEDIFIAAQDGVLALSPEHIDALFTAADLVRDLIKHDESAIPSWFEENAATIATLADQLRRMAGDAAAPTPASRPDKKAHKTAATAPPGKEKLPTEQRRQRPQPISNSDRHLRVSAQGMSRILALASEAMIESRWLPQITSSIGRLKRRQDEIWYALEKIRAQLPTNEIPATLDSGLSDIAAKLKRCQGTLSGQIDELTEHSTHSVNIAHRLHHEVISNRMQPLSEGLIGLPRLVRDLSRKLGKTVRLEVIGSETKIDRDIMDKLESPFIHLVTNAIDHGVEDPAQRAKIGKPPEATLRITAKHHAGMLVITVADDGRGLNYEALRQKAVDRRMVSAKIAAELTESELAEFLFLPKFTTRESADSTSGRGVGLDIVYNAIREIRGSIELRSIPNHGLTFELHLPLTLSIIRGLMVEINKEPYSLPLVSIDHVIRLSRCDIKEIGNRQYFLSNNKQVYIITAQQALDLRERELNDDTLSVIVVSSANTAYGLVVDRFQGIRDLVVQPLNPRLGKLKSISAAAIAEDGTPILILDVNDLRQSMDHLISGDRLQRIEPQISGQGPSRLKRILVVDDSITVREVERKVLSEHGFEVEVAVDGVEAWNLIRNTSPYNLIITDIDMPNMDGIELLVHIKESKEHENIPVIILSYKDREADRTRGLDAGADYYLTKSSFHNQALIEAVEDLIGEPGERR
jgi:two-component system sensor histidine kinase and response regulator WspE